MIAAVKPSVERKHGTKPNLKEGLQRGISLSHQNLGMQYTSPTKYFAISIWDCYCSFYCGSFSQVTALLELHKPVLKPVCHPLYIFSAKSSLHVYIWMGFMFENAVRTLMGILKKCKRLKWKSSSFLTFLFVFFPAAQSAVMVEKELNQLKRASYASVDQPSWMELARKKSQAWSDMPQIIK